MDLSDIAIEITRAAGLSTPTIARRTSMHIPRKTSWGTPIPPPSSKTDTAITSKEDIFDNVELSPKSHESTSSPNPGFSTLRNIAALGLSFAADDTEDDGPDKTRFSLDEDSPYTPEGNRPFNKWMRTLQKRATDRRKTVSCDVTGDILEKELFETPNAQRRSGHKKSSSASSYGFVTAVKSASISLASFSVAPRSRRTGVSSRQHRTDRSSKASNVGRLSEDNSYVAGGAALDQAVTNRLLQRRRILEEIISTEESYLADVKFLMNVYVTLLASIPSLSPNIRASIKRNLNDIVELHEELLGELHKAVPHSEYTQSTGGESALPPVSKPRHHHRWRSLDAVPDPATGASWLQKIPGMTAEPKIAAEVAKIFGKKMNRFFIYEEYGAKYEIMLKDLANAYKTIPQWEIFQRGLEALASSLASINSQQENARKALTIGDLLVKPIQRVCKYPLLFSELLKVTPVCDCPDSHIEIENVLIRLREATNEINRATDDPRMKMVMEKSWLLQDRLVFPDMSGIQSINAVRALGHVHLCGVLHVSWQTKDGVDGQYLICLLYRDFLLLASATKNDQIYTIQASIGLCEIRIEEIDNGKGLQCHTAPFSWKLVFEYDHRLFEVTLSACSPKEELEWRSRLADRSCKQLLDVGEQALFTSLSLDIKPLGTVFGKPGTIARRISIHRATTVGPMSGLCQVIIKNTNAFKESASCVNINRSQSLLTTNRIPVLAPSRAERIRLEALLTDVWTRDILPYPGMTGRARGEHLVRASASSMMRKLSVASIASNFTKRSGSMASLHLTTEDDESADHELPRVTPKRPRSDSTAVQDYDDPTKSRLSVIHDAKENMHQNDSAENLASLANGSPSNTMRRLATMKVKSWSHDGQRIITPPLRTSSANSVRQSQSQQRATTPLSTVTDSAGEDKENHVKAQVLETPTASKSKKSRGLGRAVVAEGIRNFFR
ncbi:Dbl homology domain-containing protein [Mollisia scopiformis]|uniref:Dbl homology domain-containing protein n=1 Tax=Mollisia scopiformis TaxID=149040 RepID=A0A194XRD8_MOLSC|nr:Dbl homology domain-containing protein [Mollisia scopiformis]KUJ22716.1 Dbl homology domain-containing protein [Mollisia scopiformis]